MDRAVIADGVIVQQLTNYIWVGLDCVLNELPITHVVPAFYALNVSLMKLNSWCGSPDSTCDLPADSTRYLPSITAYRPDGSGNVTFKYIGFLENCLDCITLRAQTKMIPAQDIVVKFVDRYGERAHRVLADNAKFTCR